MTYVAHGGIGQLVAGCRGLPRCGAVSGLQAVGPSRGSRLSGARPVREAGRRSNASLSSEPLDTRGVALVVP